MNLSGISVHECIHLEHIVCSSRITDLSSVMLCAPLTNDSEGEVQGHTAEAIGCLAHIDAGIFGFHILDLESMGKNTVTAPASVDISSILCPEQQGRRVAINGA